MMESLELVEEGVLYGKVTEVSEKYVTLSLKNITKTFLCKNFHAREGDYIRVYVRNNEILFYEVLDEKIFKKLVSIIEEAKTL